MEWYLPITILPAVALIVLSTSNFIIALNREVALLEYDREKFKYIIKLKLKQLKLLGIANGFLYGSALVFLVAGISKILAFVNEFFIYLILSGVVLITIALTILFFYSVKSVSIRDKRLKL